MTTSGTNLRSSAIQFFRIYALDLSYGHLWRLDWLHEIAESDGGWNEVYLSKRPRPLGLMTAWSQST